MTVLSRPPLLAQIGPLANAVWTSLRHNSSRQLRVLQQKGVRSG